MMIFIVFAVFLYRVGFCQEPADPRLEAHKERFIIMVLSDAEHSWKSSVAMSPASPWARWEVDFLKSI